LYLEKIKLVNFRNHKNKNFEFDKKANLVVGENGTGKTNLLESIFFASTTTSHRTAKCSEIVMKGEKNCAVIAEAVDSLGKFNIKMIYKYGGGISEEINSSRASSKQVLEKFPVIMFSPDDIETIKGPPSGIRRMVNINISQVNTGYINSLIRYRKALKERNASLKAEAAVTEISAWTDLLKKYGSLILENRKVFTEKLNKVMHYESSRIGENIYLLEYDPSNYKGDESVKKDRERGYTTWGPHRDRFSFCKNGESLSLMGSRGELRMAAVVYRLAVWSLIREKREKNPIFLMDDVFSELDETNRKRIGRKIGESQTILTSTDMPHEVGESIEVIRL